MDQVAGGGDGGDDGDGDGAGAGDQVTDGQGKPKQVS